MKKPPLKSIPTSRFSRGVRLAGLTASVGASALGGRLASMFADKVEKEAKGLLSQIKQAQKIADTLSQMKGAAMKLGQMLSMHGEHLFPKEVAEVLSRLQQHSDQMEFALIEKVLKKELGDKLGTRLVDVSREPIAAASIGQVHRAVFAPADSKARFDAAVKVQYPGVDKSIDSDVDSLASLLSVLTRFPNAEGFESVTEELKSILKQETDYLHEGRSLEYFRDYFKKDESIVVPRYFAEASTRRVLVSELVGGITVQEFAASTANAKARKHMGEKYLEVFYNELFRLGKVQTDPNFANYKIQWSFGLDEPRLVLLDFGAVKVFDDAFRDGYVKLVRTAMAFDYEGLREAAIELNILRADDSRELVDMHYELSQMFMEPFRVEGHYKWAESDLPERIRKALPKFVFAFKLRPPPKDFIFLNRKVIGVYFFCSAIKAEFNPRPILERFLRRT